MHLPVSFFSLAADCPLFLVPSDVMPQPLRVPSVSMLVNDL